MLMYFKETFFLIPENAATLVVQMVTYYLLATNRCKVISTDESTDMETWKYR